MPYVTMSDGERLYVEDFGAGRSIVFVHGGAATHAAWEHQVFDLADRFRTVTYDHRGVGASDKPSSGYTCDRLADDLAELVTSLGLGRATLVSHGLGGHVVLRCAARHPEVASGLALCAAAPWFTGDRAGAGGFSEEFTRNLRAGIGRNNPQANWELFERWLFHEDPGQAYKIAALAMALAWPAYVMKQLLVDLVTVDHRPYLERIRQPVLIMHGVHDRKNRYEGGIYLSRHLPNARLASFERSAHCPFFEELEAFNSALAGFVEETS